MNYIYFIILQNTVPPKYRISPTKRHFYRSAFKYYAPQYIYRCCMFSNRLHSNWRTRLTDQCHDYINNTTVFQKPNSLYFPMNFPCLINKFPYIIHTLWVPCVSPVSYKFFKFSVFPAGKNFKPFCLFCPFSFGEPHVSEMLVDYPE